MVARTIAATVKAEHDRRRALAASAGEANRRSPSAVKNRIDRLEADQRRDKQARDGSRRLVERIAHRQGDIDYWKGVYATQVDQGIAEEFSSSTITKGDEVRYRGRWYVVTRVNPKSVTVQMSRGTGSIRYHEVAERRSGGGNPRATD